MRRVKIIITFYFYLTTSIGLLKINLIEIVQLIFLINDNITWIQDEFNQFRVEQATNINTTI